MLEIGTEEQPAIVTCDVTEGRCRYIYVKVPDSSQLSALEELEYMELSRLSPIVNASMGSNVHWGECRLRILAKSRDLTGRKVICKIRPGAIKHIRGKYRVDLYATSIEVVGRVFCWCL